MKITLIRTQKNFNSFKRVIYNMITSDNNCNIINFMLTLKRIIKLKNDRLFFILFRNEIEKKQIQEIDYLSLGYKNFSEFESDLIRIEKIVNP